MKRMMLCIATVLLLSGCGQTQPETDTATLQQTQFIQAARGPAEDLNLPDRFAGSWQSQDGRITVLADAEITANQGTSLPAALVQRRRLTQEDLDLLLAAFAKGNPCYRDGIFTKQDYQEHIDRMRQYYEENGMDETEKSDIKNLEKEMRAAPEERPVVDTYWIDEGMQCPVFYAQTKVDGMDWEFDIKDNGTTMASVNVYRKTYGSFGMSRRELEGVASIDGIDQPEQHITAGEAQAIGDTLMEQLNLGYMVCDDIRQGLNGAQLLYYVPTVRGVRLSCIPVPRRKDDGTFWPTVNYLDAAADETGNPDNIAWSNEKIQMEIGTDGILSFRWEMPCQVTEIITDNASLMPFDKIAGIVGLMLPETFSGSLSKQTVTIHRADLTLMRIRDKGTTTGRVVPVWDFWGSADEGFDQVLLTLNAVDGSVIHRAFGY